MEQNKTNYYQRELSKVKVGETQYLPTFKIFANSNGENTKHISLHEESAKALIEWLNENFINKPTSKS